MDRILAEADAWTYLDAVKAQLGTDASGMSQYNEFLGILREFRFGSNNVISVMEKVGTLFRDYPDLIVGFHSFLPLGYGMDAASEGPVTLVVLIAPYGVATYQYFAHLEQNIYGFTHLHSHPSLASSDILQLGLSPSSPAFVPLGAELSLELKISVIPARAFSSVRLGFERPPYLLFVSPPDPR
ncbi:hypothetical protein SCHPADRAFT_940615 [Schizopora paradoxa]|uniref:PAH2 domain-containing protein n=1 Tax=Schizopora paradoxa TaxID=27342 RepID=A0A0H2S8E5_9AGAM|nr:hypothetical protein SCHPADRAFT_940615 [Schizopora paradoxa]